MQQAIEEMQERLEAADKRAVAAERASEKDRLHVAEALSE